MNCQNEDTVSERSVTVGELIAASNPDGLRNLPAARKLPASSASTDDVLDELREDRL